MTTPMTTSSRCIRALSLLALCLGALVPTRPDPALAWPTAIGSSFGEQAKEVATDRNGNTYVAGTFDGVLSASNRTVTSQGGRDVFVAKMDALGNVLWIASAGSDLDEDMGGVGVDNGGNVYVTGTFFKSIFFAADENVPDPVDLALTAAPTSFLRDPNTGKGIPPTACQPIVATTTDAFVAKLDKDGKWLWAARAGGKGYDRGNDLAVHANGVYVTGAYAHTLPFADAGSSTSTVAELPVPTERLPEDDEWDGPFCGDGANFSCPTSPDQFAPECQRRGDMFVARIGFDGRWRWAVRGGSQVRANSGNAIAVDAARNLYVVGERGFGTITTAFGTQTSFLVRLEDGGTVGQARHAVSDLGFVAADVATDGFRNVVVGGVSERDLTVHATHVQADRLRPAAVIARYADTGGAFDPQWVSQATALGFECAASSCAIGGDAAVSGVAFDDNGEAYVAGFYSPANVRIDSDFETIGPAPSSSGPGGGQTIDDWTAGGGGVIHTGTVLRAYSGRRAIDLNSQGAGSIARNLTTVAEHRYLIRFALAGNPAGDAVKRLRVSWIPPVPDETPPVVCSTVAASRRVVISTAPGNPGTAELSFNTAGVSVANPGWEEVECAVTATYDNTDLKFESLTTTQRNGPAIDDIRVIALDAGDHGIPPGGVLRFDQTVVPDPVPLRLSDVKLEPFSIQSRTDIFVARADDAGTWRWAQRAGGAGAERAVAIATGDPGELVTTGVFTDSAAFENAPPNESVTLLSAGGEDAFAARISDDGQWIAFQKWVVGQEVPRPAGACGTSGNTRCSTPRPPLVEVGGSPGAQSSFLWSPFEKKLYAVAPATATVKWFELPENEQLVPTRITTGTADFPSVDGRMGRIQTHIATAPVELELNAAVDRCGPNGDHFLYACRDEKGNATPECGTSTACQALAGANRYSVVLREGNKPSFTNNDAQIVVDDKKKVFEASRPGMSVVVYVNAATPDLSQGALDIDVIRTVLPAPPEADCTIGAPLADPSHRDPNRRNGWVMNPASPYDGAGIDRAHDRATRVGPIIPVNEDVAGDPGDDMLVAWYRQNAKGIAWPEVVTRYDCAWPANADKIVIASGLGSDGGRCAKENAICTDDVDCKIHCAQECPVACVRAYVECVSACGGDPICAATCGATQAQCFGSCMCEASTCVEQPALDPAVFPEARIYDQPDREDETGAKLPGFNPNEEHAALFPSNAGLTSPAVFALRNDLGDPKDSDVTTLSEPYVLLKYRDPASREWRMRVYDVLAEDQAATFDYSAEAGKPILPPYPLSILPACGDSCAPNLVDCGGTTATCGAPTPARKQCSDASTRKGVRCDVDSECPSGACVADARDRCSGGPRHGETCANDAACVALPTCVASAGSTTKHCQGGSREGAVCTANAQCQSPCASDLCGPETDDNLALFKDYRGLGADGTWRGWWARSPGTVKTQFFYPLQRGFYSQGLDLDGDGVQNDPPDTCVPWLDEYARDSKGPKPVTVTYESTWPSTPPVLAVGQTLLRPTNCTGPQCLPNIADQLAAEVIFEQRNDAPIGQDDRGDLVRMYNPLAERAVFLRQLPAGLTSDRDGARTVITGNVDGKKLPFALRTRLGFEPGPLRLCDAGVNEALGCVSDAGCPGGGRCKVGGRLRFRGVSDDRNLGEPLLLPNILTDAERDTLLQLSSDTAFGAAVESLYRKTRNPNGVNRANTPMCHHGGAACPLEVGFVPDMAGGARPEAVLETKALSAGDARSEGFVTLIFNNDRTLSGAPVSAQVIRVGCGPYQGQVQVIQSDNVFDEQLTLRHNGDFGGDPSRLNFEWYYAFKDRNCESIPTLPYPATQLSGPGEPNSPWEPVENGRGNGLVEITLQGAALTTLADTCIFTRYTGYHACGNSGAAGSTPSLWAGAPLPNPANAMNDPDSQLAPGWLARTTRALNPFDSRTRDFRQSATNTFASMISQAGKRYEGDIAFNGSAENLNRVGLIETYETILRRGLDLSLNAGLNNAAVNNKLLDVTSRLSGLYMLLGNEAFADAQDPTVGFDTSGDFGSLAPAIFAFQDQTDSLLSEELSLLRGREDGSGPTPIYNRLIWNFTGGTGQVAYQQNYNIRDQDQDGFINDVDARALFPQGHGDAWGHYLTAITTYYRLLRHKGQDPASTVDDFRWIPRSDSVLVAGTETLVDFTDERKFADAAAARARTGAQIVDLTYRQRWVDDPSGQWQGYKDTDPDRAFGVSEWAARAGQGAYFDWVVASGILPPTSDKPPGINKVDRTTVPELNEIVSQFTDLQAKLDQADAGLNPVGLAKNVVPFDIDPTFLDTGSTTSVGTRAIQGLSHFEQIFERALGAFKNAVRVFDNANSLSALLRKNQDTVDDFRQDVVEQERDYNNRLVEIFGSPYAEDIGPGKTYPSGYSGPDLWNYDIVEDSELTGGAPGEIEGFLTCSASTTDFAGFPCTADTDCPDGTCSASGDFTEFEVTGVVHETLDCEGADEDHLNNTCRIDSEGGRLVYEADTGYPRTREATIGIRLSNAGFGRVKDPSWTSRFSPGEIQKARSDLVLAIGQFQRAAAEHQRALTVVENDRSSIAGQNQQAADQIELLVEKRNIKVGLGAAITAAKGVELTAKRIAASLDKTSEVIVESLPKIVGAGTTVITDPAAPLRGAAKLAAAIGQTGFEIIGDVAEGSQTPLEQAQNLTDDFIEVEIAENEQQEKLFNLFGALAEHVKEEAAARVEVLTTIEALRQAQAGVQSTLARGLRAYDELIAFRRKTAASVADLRYNDMAFRIFRTDALQKYKAQFDLTAQYVYLAASAYDYETNLLGTEPNSGRRFLTDIVRHRSLGQVVDNEPIVGSRGLADTLGRMRANFEVLDSQLGFNKPDTETNRFSLRRELFRLVAPESLCAEDDDACREDPTNVATLARSNRKWREMLERHRVKDLWKVNEFRRFVRPFAPASAGPQPGIVIPFDTNVTAGLNFFGWPLSGGDSAYDASKFSTKVRSLGVWFANYDGTNLSNTPRVYLVPIGADVLRPVSAFDFTPRKFLVFDQKIPVPFPIGATDLTDPAWSPLIDNQGGSPVEIRRYDALRAYLDKPILPQDELTYSSRAVGRSVWNTKWMLIIPGGTMLGDGDEAINRFIYGKRISGGGRTIDPNGVPRDGAGISDVRILFQTYAYSGN